MSIRLKILLGCLGLTLITALHGGYDQITQGRLGAVANQIYDETVTSINRLRAAQIGIGRIERELSQPRLMADTVPRLEAIVVAAQADLRAASSHAMSPGGKAVISSMTPAFADLESALDDLDMAQVSLRAEVLQDTLEEAVAIYTADGLRLRERVQLMVRDARRRTSLAIVFAVIVALVITFVLSRSIVPALRDAVFIAQSIASGRLDNTIVASGGSETARLLRALAAMQASIAGSLDHIRTLMTQQTRSHAGELAAQHTKLEAALDTMSQGLCMFGPDDRLVMANKRFSEMFGEPVTDARAEAIVADEEGTMLLAQIAQPGHASLSVLLASGRTVAMARRPMASGGWVVTFDDVTEQRNADAKLAHMARHDPLTGLPNRLHFAQHMPAALARARRAHGLAVLCLDLDRFKAVNETLGHAAGDALLQAVAKRLVTCTRESDMVARLGSDEFAVVQESLAQPADAIALATRILDTLSAPFEIDGHQIPIGASIGVALSDGGPATPDALLKSADLALYRAKQDGSGTFRFFEKGMDAELQARRELEVDLRRALQSDELEVFYQPLMAEGRKITGFEALVRWRHPQKGFVSPGIFIPLAEEMGLIGVIGGWVLQQATRDAAGWPGTLKVAVNLSPAQFKEKTLLQQVRGALQVSGLDPRQLELEITESVLMQEDALALEMLHELRALGIRIAMDDFGTGYSSLSYLRRFPFDKIKIDQSFVRAMSENSDCSAIIKAVIGLGRSLNIAVNAEGVETEAQLAALCSEGCGEMQGFLFSKPRPASEVSGLLDRFGNATLSPRPPHTQVVWAAAS